MYGKKFYYNGQEISTIASDYIVGITGIQWVNVLSSNQRTNIAGYHGVKSSPTYLRGRQITIEGGISADTRAKAVDAMYYLRSLFALRPLTGSQEVPFAITDEQDKTRHTTVKIITPLEFEEGEFDSYDGTTRKWRVVLFADDARFISNTPNTETGIEGNFGGFSILDGLYWPWDNVSNAIECVAFGMEMSEAIVTLTATGTISSYVNIINLTTGAVFKFTLDTPLTAGDVVIVNSKIRKITINGVDKTNNRLPWSIRPIVQGSTSFVAYDIDGGDAGSDFNVSILFYDVLV